MSANVEEAFGLAAETGFDAVEIAVRDPVLVNIDSIKKLCKDNQLSIAAIGTGQAYVEEGLSLTDPDPTVRKKAIDRIITEQAKHSKKILDKLNLKERYDLMKIMKRLSKIMNSI